MKRKYIVMGLLCLCAQFAWTGEIKEIPTLEQIWAEESKGKEESLHTKQVVEEKQQRQEVKAEVKQEAKQSRQEKPIEIEESKAVKERKQETIDKPSETAKKEKEKIKTVEQEQKKEIEVKKEEKKEEKKSKLQEEVKEKEKKKETKLKELALEKAESKKTESLEGAEPEDEVLNVEDTYIAALVADRKGHIYYSKNIDQSLPMASVTKVMTLLVTFDAIYSGEASYQDKVVISKDVYQKGGSGIAMKPGQVFTLIDLIRATAIYSANNAAYAIAKHIGKGNISAFIKKMNRKAKAIGVADAISYYTPAGLPTRYTKQPMDVGTARGIYKLSEYALKHYPDYIEIAGIKNMKIHNGKISIRNRNNLIGEEGIYGIKTGFHKEAKYNITVASKEGNKEFIVVVLGGNSYKQRDEAVKYLLNKVKTELRL